MQRFLHQFTGLRPRLSLTGLKLSLACLTFVCVVILNVAGFSLANSEFVFAADTAAAQKNGEAQIKALMADLESATGTQRVDLLNELCDKLIALDIEKAVGYADESIGLAQELGYKNGEIDALNHLGYISLAQDAPEDALLFFKETSDQATAAGYMKGLAYSKNGFGILWANMGDYAKGLDSFESAEELFSDLKNDKGVAFVKNNKGTIYQSMGLFDKAIVEYQTALALYERLNLPEEIAVTANNLGASNSDMGRFDAALGYYQQALEIHQQMGYLKESATELNNIGNLYASENLPEDALKFYQQALTLTADLKDEGLLAEVHLNLGSFYENDNNLAKAADYYQLALTAFKKIQNFEGEVGALNNLGGIYAKQRDAKTALTYHLDAYEASRSSGYREGLKLSLKQLASDYQALENYAEASHYLTLYTELTDALQEEKTAEAFANSEVLFDSEKKAKELLKQKAEIAERIKERNRLLLIVAIIAVSMVLISLLLVWVAKERKKSEKLLLNILPKKVADELKRSGKTVPVRFDSCTVYFSDIVNFTTSSEKLDPVLLIAELNDIFTTFDAIMEKHGCERIKTIGDAYMAVCGMPEPYPDHADRMVRASIEIREALAERNRTHDLSWRIRIGVNSGPIVGGVVGVKKYLYDVFGDTINTASRMESNSEPMRINVSKSTYEIVKDRFVTLPRAPIEVKGKGMLEMFFLEGAIEAAAEPVTAE